MSELFALHHDEVTLVGGYLLHIAPCCAAEDTSSVYRFFLSLQEIFDFYIKSFQVSCKYFNFLQYINEAYKIYYFKDF